MTWEYTTIDGGEDFQKDIEIGNFANFDPISARNILWGKIIAHPDFRAKYREFLDEGWEPVTEIGPSNLTLDYYKKMVHDNDVLSWIANPIGNILNRYAKYYLRGYRWSIEFRRNK